MCERERGQYSENCPQSYSSSNGMRNTSRQMKHGNLVTAVIMVAIISLSNNPPKISPWLCLLENVTLLSLIKNVCNCLTENRLQMKKKKLHFLFFFLYLAPFNHVLIHFHSMYKYLLMLGKPWARVTQEKKPL